MQMILGIDTGGTYTDAVLYDLKEKKVLAKAKSPTTHEFLEAGICRSIEAIYAQNPSAGKAISKVVLSTTLATNAIVEEQGRPTGLIIIGEPPKGKLPEVEMARISGKVNVKGKIITPVDTEEVEEACRKIAPKVEAFAVSGMMSVRNAALELKVKEIIKQRFEMPVVCGHELSSQLGFSDRTVTCILNASLLPIINDFIQSVRKSLANFSIDVPVFMVKGDGSLASLELIRQKPIESILSGPAASMLGAMTLADQDSGIIADMGGTTTDTAVIRNHALGLSELGAKVGRWQTQVASAEIATWGLGGDTQILAEPAESLESHQIKMKPVLTGQRILPACRGGNSGLTPTDLLHLSGEFSQWDITLAEKTAQIQAEACEMNSEDYLRVAEEIIVSKIDHEILETYRLHKVEEKPSEYGYIRRMEGRKITIENLLTEMPVIAIGAPAKAWYERVSKKTGQKVVVPEHYEVANAVGAACAGIEERMDALVRPDEENNRFNAFIAGKVQSFDDKDKAVKWAKKEAEDYCISAVESQGAVDVNTHSETIETVEKGGLGERFVQTEIKVTAKVSSLQIVKDIT